MELDPKTKSTSGSASNSDQAGQTDPLPPTENMAEGLLKGRYLLGPELGRGGFAVTYVAADLEVASRKVVVKVLNDRRSSDSWSLRKLKSEMEALARIDHPNVVGVLDFGYRADGKPFIVMQYISGRSLREMIPREGLPLAQVAQIVKQVGRGLSAAHEAGVCHRDLKPENIMIQSSEGEDQIKLIDFGMATVRTSDSSESTSIAGTHFYMAPEQFEGRSSPASDVYQMGVVAYELVTGILPFRATTAGGIVLQQMAGLTVLPKSLRPELPEVAQEAILKALSPNPRDRYERARDFGDALAGALVSGDLEPVEWLKSGLRVPSSSHLPVLGPPQRRRLRSVIPMAASLVIVLALAAAAYFFFRPAGRESDSIAVLPFENRTGDPGMAYLTEGLTESLINDLSRIPTLRVTALGSVLRYGSYQFDVKAVGRDLHVSRVIEGSVSRDGDSFFLNTELIDVPSGVHLWGDSYTGKISSLANVLEEFSTKVTDQLRLKLSGSLKDRLKRQHAAGSPAYEQYLKGRFHLSKRTGADFEQAVGYFNEAIATDPDYALAYSGLADAYRLMAFFGRANSGVAPIYALEKSRAAAQGALQLDSTLAEAYAARAAVEMQADYNWRAAEQDYTRAIELNANWPDAHEGYAFELAALGRFDEGLREIGAAEERDPNQFGFHAAHSLILYQARRNDESIRQLQTFFKSRRELSRVADAMALMAMNYWADSKPAQALQAIESIAPDASSDLRIPLLVTAYARAGQEDKARRLLATYVAHPETTWWYYLALAHLSLHQTNDAIRDLESGYAQRSEETIWLGVDPLLDQLRDDSRFRALIVRIKLDR